MKNWQKNLSEWKKQPFIKRLFSQFPQAEVYLVGGAVRDCLLDRPTKDFDFVIRNVSKVKLNDFLKTQGQVNLVGSRFGVFKFRPKNWTGEEIDIALPRTEHSLNQTGAYRDFKINSQANLKIEDDLSRRDFTVNALAYDLKKELLLDPFNGQKDLNQKIIRAVGDPQKRLTEDYSRILRGIRLAVQLDFAIEAKTWQAIKKNIASLNKTVSGKRIIAYEVIAKELYKAVNANPLSALELLDQSQAIKNLLPELLKMKKCPQPKIYHTEGDVWCHTVLAIKNLSSMGWQKEFKIKTADPAIIWALLFHDLGKPFTLTKTDRIRFNNHDNVSVQKFRQLSDRLRLSSAGLETEVVEKLISKHMLPTHGQIAKMKDTTIEKYFFNPDFPGEKLLMVIYADIAATIGPKGRPDWQSYRELKKRITRLTGKQGQKKQLPKVILNGHEIIKKTGLKPGPQIGKLLLKLREEQLRGRVKNKTQALVYLKKLLSK